VQQQAANKRKGFMAVNLFAKEQQFSAGCKDLPGTDIFMTYIWKNKNE